MSSCDCPYLSAPACACARFHWRNSVRVFTGAVGPRLASHLLKSRFIPYLKTTEQPASMPFAQPVPRHTCQCTEFWFGSWSTMLGLLAGSTTTTPHALSKEWISYLDPVSCRTSS